MPRVFISYRRSDARQDAGRLSDALVREFGEENVFMDLASLVPGQTFLAEIDEAIDSSDVVLVVIGRQWLTLAGDDGLRRLDDPDDPVRLEVAAAMARARAVIPVLVQGAPMPDDSELPAPLLPLRGYQACELSDLRWNYDVDRLIAAIELIAPSPGQKVMQTAGRVFPPFRRRHVRWAVAVGAIAAGAWLGWWWFGGRPGTVAQSGSSTTAPATAAAVTAPAVAAAGAAPDASAPDPSVLFALPPAVQYERGTQIRSVRVLAQEDDGLGLEVVYHYAGDFGAGDIVLVAEVLDEKGNHKVTSRPSVGVGNGTGTVRLSMRAMKVKLPFDTTTLTVGYYRMTETGTSRSFELLTQPQRIRYAKTWK